MRVPEFAGCLCAGYRQTRQNLLKIKGVKTNSSPMIKASEILKYYQFAFCILPDDLQAAQLVIDGVSRARMESRSEQFPGRIEIIKNIFVLGKNRVQHFPAQTEMSEDAFFRLKYEQRVCLWLCYQLGFYPRDMALIFGQEEFKVYNDLLLAEYSALKWVDPEGELANWNQQLGKCPHSSKFFNRLKMINLNEGELEHLAECGICSNLNQSFRKKEMALINLLPIIRIDEKTKGFLDSELSGLKNKMAPQNTSEINFGFLGRFNKYLGERRKKKSHLQSESSWGD